VVPPVAVEAVFVCPPVLLAVFVVWPAVLPPAAAVVDVEVPDVLAAFVPLSPISGASAKAASGPIDPGVVGVGDRKTKYIRRQKLRSMAKIIRIALYRLCLAIFSSLVALTWKLSAELRILSLFSSKASRSF